MKIVSELLRLIAGWFGFMRDHTPDKTPHDDVSSPANPATPAVLDYAWLKTAKADIGIKEIKGELHNPKVLQYAKDAGVFGISDDETSWCALFTNAHLERSGNPGTKSAVARSFETWGKPVKKPKPGDVAVFWRVSPTDWRGHVGFFMGFTKEGDILVLGGNQGNKVSIAPYPKEKLIGFRKPVTALNSRTHMSNMIGTVADTTTGGLVFLYSIQDVLNISNTLKSLGDKWWMIFISIGISIIARAFNSYARDSDLKNKGR